MHHGDALCLCSLYDGGGHLGLILGVHHGDFLRQVHLISVFDTGLGVAKEVIVGGFLAALEAFRGRDSGHHRALLVLVRRLLFDEPARVDLRHELSLLLGDGLTHGLRHVHLQLGLVEVSSDDLIDARALLSFITVDAAATSLRGAIALDSILEADSLLARALNLVRAAF